MITKFNQYQVHAECRKSFAFLCLVYKTAFKERRNFLKKTGKSEIKMEEVVNVKREEILSSPELKHSKKTLWNIVLRLKNETRHGPEMV